MASTVIGGMTNMTGYLYDADGNRVAKGKITTWGSCDPTANGFQITQNYVLGPGGEELSMLDGDGNWQRTNVYAGGKLVGTYDLVANPANPSAQIPWLHFHLADHLGTRRMQVSGMLANLGQPETDFQSLPFGDQFASSPDPYADTTANDATPLHFTGKERDLESGNDYFGARYYASSMGRFLSPDWSAKYDPIPYATLGDPQSLNLYSYVRNNPVTAVDADGHFSVSGFWNDTLVALGITNSKRDKDAEQNEAHEATISVGQKLGSYVYMKGFKGSGEELSVKVGPVKFEVGHKEGTEMTRHLNGEKEEKEIKSDIHAKVEVAGYSVGVERTMEGDASKSSWQFSAGKEGVEGSGGQVGIEAGFCHTTCSSIGAGVEAGRLLHDMFSTPDGVERRPAPGEPGGPSGGPE